MIGTTLVASAAMAMSSASCGFQLWAMGQTFDFLHTAAPSAGVFRYATDELGDSKYTSNQWLLSATGPQWAAEREAILASSWIAVDAKGGPGNWSLGSGPINRPIYSETNGSLQYLKTPTTSDTGFQGVSGNTATHMSGGFAGWSFALINPLTNRSGAPSDATDLPVDIFGNNIDALQSIFVGHFALTDPNAFLVGKFMIGIKNDSGVLVGPAEGFEIDLNGSFRYGVRLAQVRGPDNTIDLYVVDGVPAPGALGALALAGVLSTRRRR